jgi:carboxypeptidase family protein
MHAYREVFRKTSKPQQANLNNIRIASPCPADWNKMVGDERVRHCAECNLNVYNLSAMTERQIQELMAVSRGKRLCARFYRRADGTVLTQDCPWSLRALKQRASRIAAAMLAAMMSIGVAFGKNNSQQSSSQPAANRQATAGVWIMVLDPQGALVPGADVRLIDSSGRIYAKTSSSDLLFFPPLPSGNYLLVIDAPGFHKFSQQVALQQDKLEDLKAKLTVSEASTGLLVISDEPLVQTETTVSTTFDRKMLDAPLSPVGPGRGGPLPLRQ